MNIPHIAQQTLTDLANASLRPLGYSEQAIDTLIALHLDEQNYIINRIGNFAPIQASLKADASAEQVRALMQFEDPTTAKGLFRIHCRNLYNRTGVKDVMQGNAVPPLLAVMDLLTPDALPSLCDISGVIATFQQANARAPEAFRPQDLASVENAAKHIDKLDHMRAGDAHHHGINQGWLKIWKGMTDGARYLRQYNFQAAPFIAKIERAAASELGRSTLIRSFASQIREVGPALAANFFADCGYAEFSKPDTHVLKLVAGLTGEQENASKAVAFIEAEAARAGVSPRYLDKLFFLVGSGNFYLADLRLNGSSDWRRQQLIDACKSLHVA